MYDGINSSRYPAMKNLHQNLVIKQPGLQDYESVWQAMKQFTLSRQATTSDELWIVEHPPVYTLGLNGKQEHIIDPGTTPVVNVDRGGQVTYHGPGQLVAYTLIDLKRCRTGIKEFVRQLEQTIINLLAEYNIPAVGREDAPGVYVNQAKIAALGLRVKRHHVYHGLSLNVDMDLEPFSRINPCGYEDMTVTQISELAEFKDMDEIREKFIGHFAATMGYNTDSSI